MVRFLAIGDSHIPRRAKGIPKKILDKLEELTEVQPFNYIFFTGDLINAPEFIDFLNQRTNEDIFIVIGNMDFYGGNRNAPVYHELKIPFYDGENIIIGLTHGAQIQPRGDHLQLENLAIEKNFNILIIGHTHKEELFLTKTGILLLNPGSVTGAWSFVASGIPSFSVININEQKKEITIKFFLLDKKINEISETKSYFLFKNNKIEYKF
ncbi:MAG: YfcE family phosphodiesterase [Promethearchaeota archaeon]